MPTAVNRSGIRRANRGRNHTYTIDGQKAIGVTTAIGQGVPKPALPYWSARVVAEHVTHATAAELDALRALGTQGMIDALKKVPFSQRDAAAVRGTDVHTYAEQALGGNPVTPPDNIAGYVDAAVKFMDDWKVGVVLAERVVGHRTWGYCGTFDLVADIGDTRWLLDWKTTASGIWPETALQLAAYRYAEAYVADPSPLRTDTAVVEIPMTEIGIERCGAVWLRADGTYDLIPVAAEEDQFQFFLHALWIARRTDGMKAWVGEAIYP